MSKVAVVACVLGLACGQVVPNGMAEPLTKMAERMAKVPRTRGRFLRADDDAVTLHVAEPAKISSESGKDFVELAQKVMDVQQEEMKILDASKTESVQLNLLPPTENLSLTKARLAALFKKEDSEADQSRAGFWKSVHGSFLEDSESLEQMINSVGTAGGADKLRFSGALARAASVLRSDSASSYEKGLAGSLITLLTDTPVSSTSSDVASGSNGHVTIVMPSPQRIYGHGNFAQLESRALPEYPLATQTASQAQTPDVVHINFDVPHASFLQSEKKPIVDVRLAAPETTSWQKALNALIQRREQMEGRMMNAIRGEFMHRASKFLQADSATRELNIHVPQAQNDDAEKAANVIAALKKRSAVIEEAIKS